MSKLVLEGRIHQSRREKKGKEREKRGVPAGNKSPVASESRNCGTLVDP